ncbi:MAG: hypothetical protein ACK4UW_18545 [Rhizobium rhizophilum]|uniref:hypothetical protein n=1 Tax=Rhizobium rhizophilum TaxID=1850373 RepID=UPI00391C7CD9
MAQDQARHPVSIGFEVGDQGFHLSDLAHLCLDDLVGELPHARITDMGAFAGP